MDAWKELLDDPDKPSACQTHAEDTEAPISLEGTLQLTRASEQATAEFVWRAIWAFIIHNRS